MLLLCPKKLYGLFGNFTWILYPFFGFMIGAKVLYGFENLSSAMDENGTILAAWQENTDLGTEIKASAKPFGAFSWEPPVTLSVSPTGSKPILVVTANGSDTMAVAVWAEFKENVICLYGSMRPSMEGGWTSGVQISEGSEELYGDYKLDINSKGEAIVTWTSLLNEKLHLRFSEALVDTRNSWAAPLTVSY